MVNARGLYYVKSYHVKSCHHTIWYYVIWYLIMLSYIYTLYKYLLGIRTRNNACIPEDGMNHQHKPSTNHWFNIFWPPRNVFYIYIYCIYCVCVYQWHICVAMYFTIVACSGKQKYTSKTTSEIFKIVSMMTGR